MYFGDRVLDSLEEALSIGELPCINVVDGRLEWVSSWAKSKTTCISKYL